MSPTPSRAACRTCASGQVLQEIGHPEKTAHANGMFGKGFGPRLLAYPKETVVAEKLEALVKLGIANTRMKDFYDLEVLFRTFAFEGKTLAQAIQNTFQKRGTDLPMGGLPVAFTPEFYDDLNKKRQWTAFCARNKSYVEETEFKAVMEAIRDFLALPVRTVQEGHSFTKTWKPGGPWH